MFTYGPADATAVPKPQHLLPPLNPDWFYLSATGLPRLSLNGCSISASSSISSSKCAIRSHVILEKGSLAEQLVLIYDAVNVS